MRRPAPLASQQIERQGVKVADHAGRRLVLGVRSPCQGFGFGHEALDRLLVQGPWAAHLEAARLRASRRHSLDLARDGALVAAQETRDVSATLAFRPPLLQETPLFFGHVGVARIPGHVE